MRKNIITDCLILRPSDDRRDLENYIKHIKDEDSFFFQYGMPYSPELAEAIDFHSRGVIYYTVFLKNSDTMIGYVGILPLHDEYYTGALEFYFFEEYRKKGYAKEAVNAYIQACINGELTDENIEHIITEVFFENETAKAFLVSIGFIFSAIGLAGYAGNISDGNRNGYKTELYEYKVRKQAVADELGESVWFLDAECLYGKDADGDVVSIGSLKAYLKKEICIEGKFTVIKEHKLIEGVYQLECQFIDETGGICLKIKTVDSDREPFVEELNKPIYYKVKGTVDYEKGGKSIYISVSGIKPINRT